MESCTSTINRSYGTAKKDEWKTYMGGDELLIRMFSLYSSISLKGGDKRGSLNKRCHPGTTGYGHSPVIIKR